MSDELDLEVCASSSSSSSPKAEKANERAHKMLKVPPELIDKLTKVLGGENFNKVMSETKAIIKVWKTEACRQPGEPIKVLIMGEASCRKLAAEAIEKKMSELEGKNGGKLSELVEGLAMGKEVDDVLSTGWEEALRVPKNLVSQLVAENGRNLKKMASVCQGKVTVERHKDGRARVMISGTPAAKKKLRERLTILVNRLSQQAGTSKHGKAPGSHDPSTTTPTPTPASSSSTAKRPPVRRRKIQPSYHSSQSPRAQEHDHALHKSPPLPCSAKRPPPPPLLSTVSKAKRMAKPPPPPPSSIHQSASSSSIPLDPCLKEPHEAPVGCPPYNINSGPISSLHDGVPPMYPPAGTPVIPHVGSMGVSHMDMYGQAHIPMAPSIPIPASMPGIPNPSTIPLLSTPNHAFPEPDAHDAPATSVNNSRNNDHEDEDDDDDEDEEFEEMEAVDDWVPAEDGVSPATSLGDVLSQRDDEYDPFNSDDDFSVICVSDGADIDRESASVNSLKNGVSSKKRQRSEQSEGRRDTSGEKVLLRSARSRSVCESTKSHSSAKANSPKMDIATTMRQKSKNACDDLEMAQKSAAQMAELLATAIAGNTFASADESEEDNESMIQKNDNAEIHNMKKTSEVCGEENVNGSGNDNNVEMRQGIGSKTVIQAEGNELPRVIKDWKVSDVVKFLIEIELGHVVQTFRDNGIDGLMLLDLEEQDLKTELGLTMLQAKKILKRLAPHKG